MGLLPPRSTGNWVDDLLGGLEWGLTRLIPMMAFTIVVLVIAVIVLAVTR